MYGPLTPPSHDARDGTCDPLAVVIAGQIISGFFSLGDWPSSCVLTELTGPLSGLYL